MILSFSLKKSISGLKTKRRSKHEAWELLYVVKADNIRWFLYCVWSKIKQIKWWVKFVVEFVVFFLISFDYDYACYKWWENTFLSLSLNIWHILNLPFQARNSEKAMWVYDLLNYIGSYDEQVVSQSTISDPLSNRQSGAKFHTKILFLADKLSFFFKWTLDKNWQLIWAYSIDQTQPNTKADPN